VGKHTDVWKGLAKVAPVGLERVSITASPVFAPCEVEWDRFTVITGNHGAGKTYLLRALVASFPDRPRLGPSGPPFERHLYPYSAPDDGRADSMTGQHVVYHRANGTTTSWEVDLGRSLPERLSGYTWLPESRPPYGEYVDAVTAFDTDYYWALSSDPDNDEDRKHTEGPFSYSAKEIRALRTITGRHYDELRWYSYEADTDMIVPRPEGVVDGRVVTAARMSRGELWVHFLLYVLRAAGSGSTVVIDEPETYLSPVGHAALLDELAACTLSYGVQTIVATHSTAMIARTPPTMLRVLAPGPDGVRVIHPATTEAALQALGHRTPVGGVIFVEDKVAKRVVTTALARLDRSLADQVDVIDAKGASEALAGARVLSRSRTLRACALLDGDQRRNIEPGQQFPIAVLPGESPDDELLRCARADPVALAELLGRPADDVILSLDRVRFVPHQYWWTGAAGLLGVDDDALIGGLVLLWLRNSEVEDEMRRVFAGIRQAWTQSP
jgi:hypothetical protein